jgi:hypothetical protein
MATSRSRSSGSSRRATSRAPSRSSSRASGRRAAGTDDVEVVEEAGGMDLDAGVGIVTFVLLIVALVLVDYEMGQNMAAGILFK